MQIIGHDKIINFFEKSIEKKALSHAYLFSGPESVGKFTLAKNLAEKLTGYSENQINPNLFIIEPEIIEKKGIIKKNDIKVEQVRELEHNLSLSSYNESYKIAIINDAHYLTKSAQNALLKTLEEPPRNSVIILVASDRKKLLPTILSRCYEIKFKPVDLEEIEKMIDSTNGKRKEISFWSLGCPGLAHRLLNDSEELNKRELAQKEFNRLINENLSETFSLAESWSKDIPSLIEMLNFWVIILRENMLGRRALSAVDQKKAFFLLEKINQSLETLKETNANARLVVENILLAL